MTAAYDGQPLLLLAGEGQRGENRDLVSDSRRADTGLVAILRQPEQFRI